MRVSGMVFGVDGGFSGDMVCGEMKVLDVSGTRVGSGGL